MEFKFRANYVMSKNLTVEADNLKEAMEKAKIMAEEPIQYKDLTMTRLYFDEIGPIKWMEEGGVK